MNKVINLSTSIQYLTNVLLMECDNEQTAKRLRTAINWLKRAELGKELTPAQQRILDKQ